MTSTVAGSSDGTVSTGKVVPGAGPLLVSLTGARPMGAIANAVTVTMCPRCFLDHYFSL